MQIVWPGFTQRMISTSLVYSVKDPEGPDKVIRHCLEAMRQ